MVNTKDKTDDKENQNFESAEMWIEANGAVKQEKSEDNHVTRNSSPSLSNLSSGMAPVVQNIPVNILKRKFPEDESKEVFLDDMILQPLISKVRVPLRRVFKLILTR